VRRLGGNQPQALRAVHAAEKAAVDLCCRASRDAATAAGVQQLWFQVMQVTLWPDLITETYMLT
jgi:hypothetical protein